MPPGRKSVLISIKLSEDWHGVLAANCGKIAYFACLTFNPLLYRLDLLKDTQISLSANHLQKLRLSFQLATPLGRTFKPHQVQ
jgi:hypothetical protein